MRLTVLLMILLFSASSVIGQEKKKEEKKADPRVVLAVPLGAQLGVKTKIALRGFLLEDAKEVKLQLGQGSLNLVEKGKAAVPDKNPEKVGDTQVVIELTLDKDFDKEAVEVVIITNKGETKPHSILVESKIPVVNEKEPNDGFSQAQTLKLPTVIEGKIERPRDVDVYRLEGKAGQKIRAEVLASRHGSPLDSILTLYTQAGQELASNDDFASHHDSKLEVTLPADGIYFLTLIDAHDLGSAIHAYRLVVRSE